MTSEAIRRCGTVCEAFHFDPSFSVTVAQTPKEDEPMESRGHPPTREECAFARRGHDHQGVYIFMPMLSRERLVAVATTLRMGLAADHLPYPADYVARTLNKLSEDERDEAWDLFGKGVEP